MKKDRGELLVFDEPAASLDPSAEASLFDKILELKGTVRASLSKTDVKNSELTLMKSCSRRSSFQLIASTSLPTVI